MAVNRFWGQAPVAEFSPISMQEMAFAPQQLYQRDQDLTAKVDAMNDASSTLKTMLGDKAGATEEFDSKYQQILNNIAKEGATSKNVEAAKQLRQAYIKDVQPMEEFAKQRQMLYQQYLKDTSSGDKILIGQNPLNVPFDEWNKTKSLTPYQAVDRNRLLSHGTLIGKQWAEGNTSDTVNQYGFLESKKGFKTADEAVAAYQSDPKFKQWVDAQTELASKASGVTNPNVDVLNTIRGGIMTSTVGGVEMRQLPSEYIKDMLEGKTNLPNGGINILDVEPMAASAEKNWDVIMQDPVVKQSLDSEVSRMTAGAVKSMSELEAKIKETKPGEWQPNTDALSPFHAPMASRGNTRLADIRDNIRRNVMSSAAYNTDISLMPSESIVSHMDPKLITEVEKSKEGLVNDISRNISTWANDKRGIWGGATSDDRRALIKFSKAPEDKRKMQLRDFRVNVGVNANGETVGSGQPTAVFWVKWGDKPEEQSTVSMNLPKNLMDKVRLTPTLLTQRYGSPEQKDLVDRTNSIIDRYYSLENKYLQKPNK